MIESQHSRGSQQDLLGFSRLDVVDGDQSLCENVKSQRVVSTIKNRVAVGIYFGCPMGDPKQDFFGCKEFQKSFLNHLLRFWVESIHDDSLCKIAKCKTMMSISIFRLILN